MKLKSLNSGQRTTVAVIVGLVLIFGVFSYADIAKQVSVTNASGQKLVAESALGQMPVRPMGYDMPPVTRDPFALPPQSLPSASQAKSAAPPRSSNEANRLPPKPQPVAPDLKLTGIAGADGVRIAVIRAGNKSVPYKPNDIIEGYRLAAINEESVVLAGPSGKRTLYIERSTPKGGNMVAK